MICKGDMFAMVMDFCAILGSGSLLASGEGMYCLICCHAYSIWASSRENLSSGFPTKQVSNQSPQLQRLARKLKFHL